MTYLLDTNVVTALRVLVRAEPRFRAWAEAADVGLFYLSAISIFEIELGVAQMERRDPRQAAALRIWFQDQVLTPFAGRILAIDEAVARRSARLHVPDPRPERGAMIAATALVHGLIVVTRNVRDFEPNSVKVLNPWD